MPIDEGTTAGVHHEVGIPSFAANPISQPVEVTAAAASTASAAASVSAATIGGLDLDSAAVLSGHGAHPGFVKASGGSDDTELMVNTTVIRTSAERGRAAIKELGEIISSMREMVAGSESYWTGQAADHFREAIATGISDYERCLNDVSEYPRELISYVDEYEGVITRTEMIANSLEDVVWTES